MVKLEFNPIDSKYYLYVRGIVEAKTADQYLQSSKGYRAHKAKPYNVIQTLDELVLGFESSDQTDILESSMTIANQLSCELEIV